MIPNRVGIEQRPSIAAAKTQIGHWEGDTMIGSNHLGAIATHVDKASKFLVARVMSSHRKPQHPIHFNKRDINAVLAVMHPDVEWASGMEGGYVHGYEAVRDY